MKKKIGFTNMTAAFVLLEDAAVTAFVLFLCYLCIHKVLPASPAAFPKATLVMMGTSHHT